MKLKPSGTTGNFLGPAVVATMGGGDVGVDEEKGVKAQVMKISVRKVGRVAIFGPRRD